MNKRLTLTCAAFANLAFAQATQASDGRCDEPMANWQPRAVVAQMAADHGWTVRRIKIDDGCYEIYARDENGRDVEIVVNPATLDVRRIKSQKHDNDDEGHTDKAGKAGNN